MVIEIQVLFSPKRATSGSARRRHQRCLKLPAT